MKLHDRYTGEVLEGEFTEVDDFDMERGKCPVCGSRNGAQCTTEDGSELARWVHSERTEIDPDAPDEDEDED